MKYASAVVRSARLTVRNPFAVVLVSVGVTVSLLPFVTGVIVAGVLGGLVGLWLTSFMLGFVGAGGARLMTIILERESSLGTDYFWEGLRDAQRIGPAIGVGTFVVSIVAIVLLSLPGNDVISIGISLLGVYLLAAWFVVVVYALSLWAAFENARDVRSAFVDGVTLILEEPTAAGWILVQSVGWTLLMVPLIIAPVIVLPGFVQLIATEIVRIATIESDRQPSVVSRDEDDESGSTA
ncbi:hypothetical protein [Halococcus sp. IIIV-5B]|uniref:hypothetical protein n=1 Tax=Halococcus sp. IIIV-5B TaxID=2321230 RepID=UPI000E708767|nr:hypothetical protein [Halococcus sp. IIIV-5B]RJT07890.1 hypothetical protein D3261_00590 [Halococcus sp. IIIV-5B]